MTLPIRVTSVLLALLVVAAGCVPRTPPPGASLEAQMATATPEAPGETGANACAYRAVEPTPTPSPTPRPSPTPALSSYPTPTPEEVWRPVYPDYPQPDLPEAVKPWQQAIVRVTVEYEGVPASNRQGLVVDPAGKVITALEPVRLWSEYAKNRPGEFLTALGTGDRIRSITVHVPGRGPFAADVAGFDPRTGVTLLTTGARGLTAAPAESTGVTPGEPVMLLTRNDDDTLGVTETFATTSVKTLDEAFFFLSYDDTDWPWGAVLVTRDGDPVGLSISGQRTAGDFVDSGGIWGPRYFPGALLSSAGKLLQERDGSAATVPEVVVYHYWEYERGSSFVDDQVTRNRLAQPVQEKLHGLGNAVAVEGLGERAYRSFGDMRPFLELLYDTPQDLRDKAGNLLGRGRYIALWWDRGEGLPDLALCGTERGYLGAAFEAGDLGILEEDLEQAARAARSVPQWARLPGSGSRDTVLEYSYPFLWTLTPDKPAYFPGEPVTLTFSATNISPWPMPLDYLPPAINIRGLRGPGGGQVTSGDEHTVLAPGETVSSQVTWDQKNGSGVQVGPGLYAALSWVATPWRRPLFGPQTHLNLIPVGGALEMTYEQWQSVTDAELAVALPRIEFTQAGTTMTARVAWAAPWLKDSAWVPEVGQTPLRADAWYAVDHGARIGAQGRVGGHEDGATIFEWALPPVPANMTHFAFVVTRIGEVEGRWEFTVDLRGTR